MKAFYILLLAMLASSSTYAQIIDHYREIAINKLLDSEHKVDSIVVYSSGFYSYKHTYTYNMNGNRLSDLIEMCTDSISTMKKFSLTDYIYDSKGNIITQLKREWSDTDWVNKERSSYKYDKNDSLIDIVLEKWDGTNWNNYSRYTYSFDSTRLISNKCYYLWQNDKDWVKNTIDFYEYNNAGYLMTYTREYWIGDSMEYKIKQINNYDNSNNLIFQTQLAWSNNTWTNDWQFTRTYSVDNLLLSVISQSWSSADSSWKNQSKLQYSYNVDKNVQQELTYSWKDSAWEGSLRSTYYYTMTGKPSLILSEESISGEWRNSTRTLYSYRDNDFLTEIVKERWFGNQWGYLNGTIQFGDKHGTRYTENGNKVIIYYEGITGTEKDQELIIRKAKLYPNPINNSSRLYYSVVKSGFVSIDIYNSRGSFCGNFLKGYKEEGNYIAEINVAGYPAGEYYYRIMICGNVVTGKIIIFH